MSLIGIILLVVLIALLIGAMPVWRHSAKWSLYPSAALGGAVAVVVVLLLVGGL